MAGLDNLLGGIKKQGESFKNINTVYINKEEIVSKYAWEFDKDIDTFVNLYYNQYYT